MSNWEHYHHVTCNAPHAPIGYPGCVCKVVNKHEGHWQPIDTVPKDGTAFLCGWWSPHSDYWWVVKAHWANGAVDGGWDGAREPVEVSPSHCDASPITPTEKRESQWVNSQRGPKSRLNAQRPRSSGH